MRRLCAYIEGCLEHHILLEQQLLRLNFVHFNLPLPLVFSDDVRFLNVQSLRGTLCAVGAFLTKHPLIVLCFIHPYNPYKVNFLFLLSIHSVENPAFFAAYVIFYCVYLCILGNLVRWKYCHACFYYRASYACYLKVSLLCLLWSIVTVFCLRNYVTRVI